MSAAPSLDATFAALADPVRRATIELLRRSPQRAGTLAEKLELIPPAMSRQLRVLRECGLVDEGPAPDDRRARVYFLKRERFAELQTWLTGIESFWSESLDAFSAHAAKRKKGRSS